MISHSAMAKDRMHALLSSRLCIRTTLWRPVAAFTTMCKLRRPNHESKLCGPMNVVTLGFLQLPEAPVTVLILLTPGHGKPTVFDVVDHSPRPQPCDGPRNRLCMHASSSCLHEVEPSNGEQQGARSPIYLAMADDENILALEPICNVLHQQQWFIVLNRP